MTDYISRDAALRDWPLCDEPADAYQYIRSYPAADVRPVVRGKWIKMTGMMPPECTGHYECSLCGWHGRHSSIEREFNFCPNCGADMREPPKEET